MAMGLSAAGVAALAGAGMNAYAANKNSKNATSTTKAEMDPRVASMLFGAGGEDKGLLSQYQGMLGKPQDAQLAQFGKDNLNYLGNANSDMGAIRGAATNLLGPAGAPQAAISAYAAGNKVAAPSQNNMNLSGSYDKFINGDAGANPYLTKAIGGAIDQSTNQFRQMQGDATDNLMRNIMPSIRSNSVLSGQYGGSRQGIAEGNAISDFTKQQGQAMTQFGQNNTNQAVGAQAQAFNQGQDRSLAATQGLGAQQYGVASQDANTKNAAEFMNVGNTQQTNLANLGATQNQNALNLSATGQGAGMLGGLLGTATTNGQNQDGYALHQAQGVNSLLAPYLGQVPGSTTNSQPLYSSTAGNMLGGATAGVALYNQLKGSFGGNPAIGSGIPGIGNPGAGANGFVDWTNVNAAMG